MNKMKTHVGLRADFDVDLRKVDADGNEISIRRAATAVRNLITDAGMDRFATPGLFGVMAYLVVGTGDTAPANGDTDLAARVAVVAAGGVGDNVFNWDDANPNTTVVYTRVYTFPTGAAAGQLKELGLSTTSTGSINTRALFKDAFGDPTVIDVDSDEQLIVTYRFYLVWGGDDSILIKTQNGIEYTLTLRPALMGQPEGKDALYVHGCMSPFVWPEQSMAYNTTAYAGATSGVGPATGYPLGSVLATEHSPIVRGTYVPGTYVQEDALTVTLAQFNGNDLGAILTTYGFPFKTQIGISPRLNKTSLDTVKFTASIAWARLP